MHSWLAKYQSNEKRPLFSSSKELRALIQRNNRRALHILAITSYMFFILVAQADIDLNLFVAG